MSSSELSFMPAWRIRELIGQRDVSPVEVTEHFLGRIEELDKTLFAFRKVDWAGAREQAKRAEEAVKRRETLGPLHGIPIALKEHIPIKGLPTINFGAPAPSIAEHDDITTERLRKAGAVIVGSNVMPGMGNYIVPGRTNTAPGDLTKHARNPWDPTRVPGSSSAGGAAAVAAGMLPIAIGSDGGGSTRLPAALSGVIGVHPTRGRIPYVNYASPMLMTMVSFGPITRDARDAAITMQALAGPDGRDFICMQDDPPDYLAKLDSGVQDLRFAWTDDYGYGSMYALKDTPRVIKAVRDAAQSFSKLGGTLETTKEVWEDFWKGFFATNLIYGNVPVVGVPKPTPAEAESALETRARNFDRFRALFSQYDLLLSPTIQFTAWTVEEWDAAWNKDGAKYPHNTFSPTYTSDTHMFNWLGWPAVSVPCGFIDGLPIGLQLVGPPNSEDKILRAAAAFLKAAPRNERPKVS